MENYINRIVYNSDGGILTMTDTSGFLHVLNLDIVTLFGMTIDEGLKNIEDNFEIKEDHDKTVFKINKFQTNKSKLEENYTILSQAIE